MVRQNPPSTSVSGTGLLAAISSNPQLAQQLGSMPADEKTIAMSSQDGADFSHPSWISESSSGTELKTVELKPAVARTNGNGFVPLRQVATLGDNQHRNPDYRIIGRLGAGGTGVVFQAHQRAVDREVAIKMLREDLATSEPSRQRFLTEARVIGGLDHPNVIAIHEVYANESGSLFYSMKRIDGTSWDQQIADLAQSQNIEILLRVADAIRYAHSRGLVHRDIKPENVMLGRFGEVLLADWGLAVNHGGDKLDGDIHHSIGGTPAYMAPELATGLRGAITYQSDVYLLGAILFQILTGFPPHAGDTLLECIRAAANNVIRSTDVEGELMDIAIKAMSTEIADRYESVDAFILAIKEQRQHQQSAGLVRRACKRLAEASHADPYENFGIADALLAEAIDVWPENTRARETRKKLQLDFARAATARGDFDLASTIYDAAGEAESDEAVKVQHERRRREASHQKVSRYSALFTHAPDAGLLIQLSSGRIVEANQAFRQLFGYSEDQVVGQLIAELNLWECPERQIELISELEREGSINDFEAKFVHTDGRLIDVLIGGRIVKVQGEQMLVSTIRDISLRKQAECDLRRSRQRLRDFQRLAGLATWSYDVRTRQVTWNTEAFQLVGRDVEQGTPTREERIEMIHPQDREKLQLVIEEAIESGVAYELEVQQLAAGGEYQPILVRGQPILDEHGKTIEVYGVLIPRNR